MIRKLLLSLFSLFTLSFAQESFTCSMCQNTVALIKNDVRYLNGSVNELSNLAIELCKDLSVITSDPTFYIKCSTIVDNYDYKIYELVDKLETTKFCIDTGLCNTTLDFPQQIHLSYGNELNTVFVTWNTNYPSKGSVQFKPLNSSQVRSIKSTQTKFVDGGLLKRTEYIHRAELSNLEYGQNYTYQINSSTIDNSEVCQSQKYSFRIPKQNKVPNFILYGDMGFENNEVSSAVFKEISNYDFDAILHVGDFAYDFDTNNALMGDSFMNQIQPIAANIQYMATPGNHESSYNFSNYINRMTTPGNAEGLWYTWDFYPFHFVSYSTEVYWFQKELIQKQYDWLDKTLSSFNDDWWVVTLGHRPYYCDSGDDEDDCLKTNSILRNALEEMWFKYKVDLSVEAHEHYYERMYPVYNNTLISKSYNNSSVPIHIITGNAGGPEDLDLFSKDPKPWSALRVEHYGYSKLRGYNTTHIYWEHVAKINNTFEVADSLWITKDHKLI